MENEVQLPGNWSEWKITRELGKGGYGHVYYAEKNVDGRNYPSAIKIINIPKDNAARESLQKELNYDEQQINKFFEGIYEACKREFDAMATLKAHTNIVSVEDFSTEERKDRIGWTIYLRMEYLTCLSGHQSEFIKNEDDAIKLGIDLCTGLEYCAKADIIHRDIKPSNIFVTEFGDFKLGDFGIAKTHSSSVSTYTQGRGTDFYMAPEIFHGKKEYDATVDLYSLGLVLYNLMNGFCEPEKLAEANDKRLDGEELPPPVNASKEFSDIILKACSYDPHKRYENAAQMRTALKKLQQKREQEDSTGNIIPDFLKQKVSKSVDGTDPEDDSIIRDLLLIMDFGYDLKRFIYKRTTFNKPFADVSDQEYVNFITKSFLETQTPVSMQPTTRDIRTAAESWISASTVKRETVLLLGFAFRMKYYVVSYFLTKHIHEYDFDFMSPMEVICFHCFWNHKSFQKAKEYFRQYEAISKEECKKSTYSEASVQQLISDVQRRKGLLGDESFLMEYLHALRARYFRALSAYADSGVSGGLVLKSAGQVHAQLEFRRLYQEACAKAYKVLSKDTGNWQGNNCSATVITPSTLENMLCSGIGNGSDNLEESSARRLGIAFRDYRMTRYRIDSLLMGKADVERTDLITLEFFLFAVDSSYYNDPKFRRFIDFYWEIDDELPFCDMSPLSTLNPYELFILMSTMEERPLDKYNAIWTHSYEMKITYHN